MISELVGRKLSMTQLWDAEGNCMPVTVIQAGPIQVVQIKSKAGADRYDAVQVGFDDLPARKGGQGDARVNKPALGHFKRHQAAPKRVLHEVRLAAGERAPEAGAVLRVDQVLEGAKKVDVTGTTKGRGFAGCMKRHKFSGGRATHGSKNHREPGAIGVNQNGHHIIKGKRLPGHMGAKPRTVRNLDVIKVEGDLNLLYVKGAIPGPNNGLVFVRKAVRP